MYGVFSRRDADLEPGLGTLWLKTQPRLVGEIDLHEAGAFNQELKSLPSIISVALFNFRVQIIIVMRATAIELKFLTGLQMSRT
ncbi:hypothetical protein AJ78_02146 [Emergomyces pasteurianus Ep9510]|uniref:Uncharacterized protein n=1 Tax=Emergomyces pasteurianus Ep9510 TaxID=1447872 RepID=A0A1J9PMX5_9EURO|nr:hypothetical protein AJ78_02146 [Emergomyces pasteurianus Ep9510]